MPNDVYVYRPNQFYLYKILGVEMSTLLEERAVTDVAGVSGL